MATTLADLRSAVRRRLEQTTSVRFSDADIDAAINAGMDEIAESSEFYEQNVSVPLKAYRTYYDLRAVLPKTALSVTDVWIDGFGWLVPSTVKDLGAKEWERSTGDPRRWFMRGLWWLGIYPKTAGEGESITVYYTALPPHLVNDNDVPLFPDDLAHNIQDYALYELFASEGETQKALRKWAEYQEGEKQLHDLVARRVVAARTSRMASR